MIEISKEDLAKVLSMSLATFIQRDLDIPVTFEGLEESKKAMFNAIDDGDLVDSLLNDYNNAVKKYGK